MTASARPDAAPFTTTRAVAADVDDVASLLDAYRQFYGQAPDAHAACAFIDARVRRSESIIFLSRDNASGAALGFTQLYPAFSSVAARRIWILNDLFVAPDARRRGVARALMQAARAFATEAGAIRLVLETAEDNHSAQKLYEALGYVRESGTRHYTLTLD
jgi:ribosomal protein S18 acetylase RimI-like enzyme